MKVLVVEDDRNKAAQVVAVVADACPDAQIELRRSYISGLSFLEDDTPALVVLDMSLPTYDTSPAEPGGRPRSYGGREILFDMARRGVEVPVIVVTGFDRFGEGDELITLAELKRELRREFKGTYVGAVYYDPSSTRWREELRGLVRQVDECTRRQGGSNDHHIDS